MSSSASCDAAEGGGLALPAGVVGEPVVGQLAGAAHARQVGLHLVVAGLGLLDDAGDGRLVEHLPHRHRPHVGDDLEETVRRARPRPWSPDAALSG